MKKHPHLRGEDVATINFTATLMETPPPAWGRPFQYLGERPVFRNTPTCVGKTQLSIDDGVQIRKHPHLRGEDYPSLNSLTSQPETPPPAWGRHTVRPLFRIKWRNTPTCVGKTSSLKYPVKIPRKHPHLRGEDCGAVAVCKLS